MKPTSATPAKIQKLYARAIPSSRSGPLYNAFSYPTKIDAEAIAIYIATHTDPGATVLDPFAGSGSTGLATRLCSRPTERMLRLAKDLKVRPKWGERHAVLYELSTVGSLLSKVMCNPPESQDFLVSAMAILDRSQATLDWLYQCKDASGQPGELRHVVWSEVLRTPCCGAETSVWDAAVRLDPAHFNSDFRCAICNKTTELSGCERVVVQSKDKATGKLLSQRKRVPAMIYGATGRTSWSRMPTADDLKIITKAQRAPFPSTAPTGEIEWGDLHRSGYHFGITRHHHLYTPRNLLALSQLWSEIEAEPEPLRDALRLWVLSYNASHSTLMTRIVAKSGQKEFAITGSQSGVLYVSGLPVEKNVFKGLRRKLDTFARAFDVVNATSGSVQIVNASSTAIDLPDGSVDYVFTDPPFGDYIPYAEINQVNEAWLGDLTDQSEEAIMSVAQGKGLVQYGTLMKQVFAEISRVLRPTGSVTVVFHASKPGVWRVLDDAFTSSALEVRASSVLNKTQASFKQVVSADGTRGDAVFWLRPLMDNAKVNVSPVPTTQSLVKRVVDNAQGNDEELDPKRLYSRYVGECIETGVPVEMSASAFHRIVKNAIGADQ